MKKFFKVLRNYLCYCGIEKEEYRAVKKDAYVSNFAVWRILHFLMLVAFGFLFVNSLFNNPLQQNQIFYMFGLIYSVIAVVVFFFLRKDSIVGQLFIYLSISVLFLFGCFITQNKPNVPATTFFVLLLLTPMFMIDKPFYMITELIVASAVFVVWMHFVKPYEVWQMDMINTLIFAPIGIFIHVIANSIRIKEFVLTRKLNIQKDYDELTGLKNKAALTKDINDFIQKESNDKGLFIVLDIDYFKKINDVYGHDVGDVILEELGAYLKQKFANNEIIGRFGGDEFIIFVKNTDEVSFASRLAKEIADEASEVVKIPNSDEKFSISLGVAIYRGEEKNYSEIFKKADIALYKTKANRPSKFNIYE